jgi:uncharacterized membrane-anchored protein YhcB (DUF1043 family)
MKPNLLMLLLLCCLTLVASAQDNATEEETATEPVATTLNEQFVQLKESSNTYNNFKIIRETRLDAFWVGVIDSIGATKEQLQFTQTKVNELQKELEGIKKDMAAKDKELAAHQHATTHISVLGIDVLKENFIYTFWGVISFLVLALLIIGYRFKENNRVTATTRKENSTLKEEMEEFKKRSLEKEKKLRRELQTERNTVEELKMMASQRR